MRSKPPDLQDPGLQRQVSRESTPVTLVPFGLLKPPLSPLQPERLPNLDKISLDDDASLAYQAFDAVDDSAPGRLARLRTWLSRLLVFTGPGWLMSVAYIDPGNLEADLQSGAQFGYTLLWALMGSTFIGLGMQLVAARLGVATKRNLAEHCRAGFPGQLRLVLWALTELAIIGSDIQEVIGCSIGLQLLFGLPLASGVVVTALAAFTFLFLERLGTRPLELFFGMLIMVLAVSMGGLFAVIAPDKEAVLKGLVVPTLPSSAMQQVVGMIGCVIMPHNLFLHSALVQSRALADGEEAEAIHLFTIESTVAILVSLMINTFVVAIFAKGFHGAATMGDIGLRNAGSYLGNAFGQPMKIVWGLGLCAAGQSSTMTGAYAGQWVMQGYLQLEVVAWKRALITRSMALIPTLFVAICFGGNDAEFDSLNTYLNILQSIVLPFAVVPLLTFAGSRRIMGDALVLSRAALSAAWLATLLVTAANIYLLFEMGQANSVIGMAGITIGATIYIAGVVYVGVVGWRSVSSTESNGQ